MDDQPNSPDRDDAATERAASMDSRPAEPRAGGGRAINAAFSRNRPEGTSPHQKPRDASQEAAIQGAGYPSEDRDDVDPEDDELGEDDLGGDELGEDDLDDEELDDGESDRDNSFEDDDGYRVGTDPSGLATQNSELEDLMPPGGAAELMPPGGDAMGGDRDTDPNLNGGHGIRMDAPEEGPIRIEDEPTDTSIIGHGHEDKAAWNRDRVAHLQELEGDERDVRPGTSESLGLGGAALAGALEGWEGGSASPALDGDETFEDELSEMEEVLGDMRLEDAEDILDDESIADSNQNPFLPEHRDLPDDNISLEERLIATDGEDSLSAGAEIGVDEALEMEDLNQTDSISRLYEDTREFLDDAMDGNEQRQRVERD